MGVVRVWLSIFSINESIKSSCIEEKAPSDTDAVGVYSRNFKK